MAELTLTDAQVIAEARSDSLLNRVRREFCSRSAALEQAFRQMRPPAPMEAKLAEFEAAQALLDLIGPEAAAQELERIAAYVARMEARETEMSKGERDGTRAARADVLRSLLAWLEEGP